MEGTLDHMDELIGKYLAGEATAEEAVQVEVWENANGENKKYVEQFKLIFDKASTVKEWQHFDEDAAWNRVKSKLQKKEGNVIDFNVRAQKNSSGSQLFWRIAASIVVAVGIGLYIFRDAPSAQAVEVVAEAKSVADTLPDGSDVFLNRKSKLVYAYDNKKKAHVVKLKGEAFFNIKHDEKKKFIIETEGIFIRDIGTSFNVKAYPESNTIEVVVKDGEVEFFTETDSGVYLHAGGKGVYNKLTKRFTMEQPESNVLSYKTKLFSFSNQDLGSAVNDLNLVYDKRIVLSDKLKRCRLTVNFNNEDIDEIVSVIAETLSLSVKESGREIMLEGPGCE